MGRAPGRVRTPPKDPHSAAGLLGAPKNPLAGWAPGRVRAPQGNARNTQPHAKQSGHDSAQGHTHCVSRKEIRTPVLSRNCCEHL